MATLDDVLCADIARASSPTSSAIARSRGAATRTSAASTISGPQVPLRRRGAATRDQLRDYLFARGRARARGRLRRGAVRHQPRRSALHDQRSPSGSRSARSSSAALPHGDSLIRSELQLEGGRAADDRRARGRRAPAAQHGPVRSGQHRDARPRLREQERACNSEVINAVVARRRALRPERRGRRRGRLLEPQRRVRHAALAQANLFGRGISFSLRRHVRLRSSAKHEGTLRLPPVAGPQVAHVPARLRSSDRAHRPLSPARDTSGSAC